MDPTMRASRLVAATGLAAGGLLWLGSGVAIAVVRPGLDSDLLFGPFAGSLLIAAGAGLASVSAAHPFERMDARSGGLLMGGAAVASAAEVAYPAGLAFLVGPILVGFFLGWVLVAGSLARQPGSRLPGIALLLGPFLALASVWGPDAVDPGLTVKVALGIAAALCLGLGPTWLAWEAVRERSIRAT